MHSRSTDYITPQSCKSLSGLFQARSTRSADAIAYQHFSKSLGIWQVYTWREMAWMVARWRLSIIEEQLNSGDRVAIMLSNGPDWIAFEQAAMSLGLVVVPLYANDRPENIAYILANTDTRLLLCPGQSYWRYLQNAISKVTSLKRIITADACQLTPDSRTICLTDWLETSAPKDFSFTPVYNELATIVYTSGTTGPPKGVMLSHQNILANSYAGLQCMDVYPDDSFLSFLPLSHMLERTAGYYMPMMAGAMVSFARSIPELAEDLVTQKPTILVSVPRIFEKIHNTITSGLQTRPAPVRKLFSAAVKTGWHNFLHQQGRTDWGADLLLQPLYDLAVGRKVRERFGGRLRIIISGGAPLGIDIAKMFIGLGLPIYQGYGLTETSPVISVNRHDDNRPEGVGRPLEGLEVKIGEHEELLVCGHCVMQGYWRNEAATAAAIDQDGWLHTGDKAIIEDGRIRITGRIKEIIVLSNGEKVAPTDMEMAIAMDPLFEHCLVIGEGRPFLSMLAVLNRGLFEELAIELAIAPDSSSLDNPQLREVILKKIETLLAGFPGFVYIRDIALSLQPWTVEEGLLTPTLKLKRAAIERHMASEIQRIYSQKNRIKKTFKQGAD